MIILDMNVLSELVRGSRDEPRVVAWVRGLAEQPVTTVVNRAELAAGLALLPRGRRRDDLVVAVDDVLAGMEHSLPFGSDCVQPYAQVVAARTRQGRPVGQLDAMIAAIALVEGAGVATRDVAGFAGLGLRLVDPWAAAPA